VTGSPLLIMATLANALLAGFTLALPVALRPAANDHPGLLERHARTLRFWSPLLLVPLMVVMGLVIDRTVVPTVLVIGGLLAALGLVTLERAGSFTSVMGAAALNAAATAALLNASILIMPLAFFEGHAARSVNLGFIAVTLGALAAVPLVRLAVRRFGVRKALLALGLACLIPGAFVACTPAEQFSWAPPTAERIDLARDSRFAFLLVALAIACPLEALLGPWAQRFASEHGYVRGSSLVMGTGFWVALLSSRLVAALLLPDVGDAWLVLVLAMLAAITLGNLIGAYSPGSAGMALWVIGACCGPLVPTLLGLVVQTYPSDAGPAVGLAMAAGALGTALAMPLVDVSRPDRTTLAAMRGAITLAVLLMAPALVLALLD
jgi:hypothetical protein